MGATATAPPPSSSIDPTSGFCHETKTFHSLRPPVPLPPLSQPLSITSYSLSLLLSTSPSSSLPDHPAFIHANSGSSISYPDFFSQVRSLSASLRSPEVGVSKGDVVFVISPTRLEVPVLYFALLSIGAVVCPTNPANTPHEVSHQLKLASPSLAFATSATAHLLPDHLPAILLDSPRFLSFLQSPPSDDDPDVEIHQSDAAVILFSSGTTGLPKAAEETHRNYVAMIAGFDAERRWLGETGRHEVTLLTAPMFHSLGFFVALKGVALGETTVIMDRPGLGGMLRAAEKHRATSMTVAPPVVVAMAKTEEAEGVDLGALRRIFCGGAPLQEADGERFSSRFPWVTLNQGYGMTEGGGISRMITPEECRNYRSVGRLSENNMAKIVDPVSGEALAVGFNGEFRMKGAAVMKGYVGDEVATTSAFDEEGWLKTGDLCFFDRDGYLYIAGRLKELIKYKGYQVPPAELEQILSTHPDVTDAAVAPYPHDEAGEVPMAYVVRRPGSTATEIDIMDFVAKQVAPYKKIRKVAFVNFIPKSPTGKILRKDLVSQHS